MEVKSKPSGIFSDIRPILQEFHQQYLFINTTRKPFQDSSLYFDCCDRRRLIQSSFKKHTLKTWKTAHFHYVESPNSYLYQRNICQSSAFQSCKNDLNVLRSALKDIEGEVGLIYLMEDEDFNSIAMCAYKLCDTDKGDFWLIFFEMTDTLAHIPVTI